MMKRPKSFSISTAQKNRLISSVDQTALYRHMKQLEQRRVALNRKRARYQHLLDQVQQELSSITHSLDALQHQAAPVI